MLCRPSVFLFVVASCGPIGPRDVRGNDAVVMRTDLLPAGTERLVVEEARHGGGSVLRVIDEAGERKGDLTEPPDGTSIDTQPAWSPDGRYVAFGSSRKRPTSDDTSIWVVSVALPGKPRRLTDAAGQDIRPTWAPDSQAIVFASTRGGSGRRLFWLDVEDPSAPVVGTPRRLGEDEPGYDEAFVPAFSPQGDRIAFAALSDGLLRIATMRADGSDPRSLTEGPADFWPTWSPDGRSIVFSARSPGRRDEDLWIVDAAGGPKRHLIDDSVGDELAPVLSADGRFVFANARPHDHAGQPFFSTVVVADLQEKRPTWRALAGPFTVQRNGIALAPRPLDAARLKEAPDYRRTVERLLGGPGESP
jgi:Tol biopolymer transport system component